MPFPLDEPVSDLEEAIEELQQCPPSELRRARKHHRRALKALRDGAYEALSDGTRDQLIERFQTNLEAMNEALSTIDEDDTSGNGHASTTPASSDSSRASTPPSQVPTASSWLW